MLVPRAEYESFLEFKKIKEYTPTKAERASLKRARLNRKKGNYLTIRELKNELGFTNR